MNALHHVTTLPAFLSHLTFRQCVEEVKKFHWEETLWDSRTNEVSQDILEAFGKNLALAKEDTPFLQNLKEKLQISKETTKKNYSKTACKVIQLFHTYFPSHLESFSLDLQQTVKTFKEIAKETKGIEDIPDRGIGFAIFQACKKGDLPALQLFLEEGGAFEGKLAIDKDARFWLECLIAAISCKHLSILAYLKKAKVKEETYLISEDNIDLG